MSNKSAEIKEFFAKEIEPIFKGAEDRLSVWAEEDKYKWGEDESVWKQHRGIDKKSYEVHFDTEFVCFVEESETINQAKINFIEAMKKLYKEGKIFVHKQMYDILQAQKDAMIKQSQEVVLPTARTEAEDLVSKAIAKSLKKSKKKVTTK